MKKKIIAIAALALCAGLCIVAAAKWPRAEASGQSAAPGPAASDPTAAEPNSTQPAAADPGTSDPGETDPVTPEPGLTPGTILPFYTRSTNFHAQYVRTDGYHEDVQYPRVTVIRSVEELSAYYEANKNLYYMESFLIACETYDETYFADRILVIVLAEAGSGSVRYQVSDVELAGVNGDELAVAIDVLTPEVGTCDMAEWHILIEPEAGLTVKDADHVNVTLRSGMALMPQPGEPDKITGEQAAEIARKAVFSAPDFVGAEYDRETGVLSVQFYPAGGTVSLRLPENWRYSMEPIASQSDGARFALHIGPDPYDAVVIRCNGAFGVCGTGLTEETIRLGEYDAVKGTYSGAAAWAFITLEPAEDIRLVILNNCPDTAWWHQRGAEVMDILNTLTVNETESLNFETVVTVPYDTVRTWFDEETATWKVNFSREGWAGGDQTVTLDEYGVILGSVYGE